MTNHARNGRAREHRVSAWLVTRGWRQIMRAAGSKGSGDLLMAHPVHGAALVQVGTAGKALGPADRARFVGDAHAIGALPLLVRTSRTGVQIHEVTLDTPAHWPVFTGETDMKEN